MLHLCFRAVSERESKTVQKIGQNQKSRSSVFLSSKTKRKRLLRRLTTHGSDKSLGVYWRIFVKIFVSATDFCRRNKSHKFRLISPSFAEASLCCRGGGEASAGASGEERGLIWSFATCCCHKILLDKQRFCGEGRGRLRPHSIRANP